MLVCSGRGEIEQAGSVACAGRGQLWEVRQGSALGLGSVFHRGVGQSGIYN